MSNRQRSRSPRDIVSRSAREKAGGGPVNMLDVAAVELAKNPGRTFKRDAERITCTIAGNRGSVHDRMTGHNNGDRRVSMRGSIIKPGANLMNRKERRAALAQRLTRGDENRRRWKEDEDERRNGHFREENKPVQRLVDPTFVPKAKAFFDHDDREGGDKWRGKSLYNPAIDFGPRYQRQKSNWDGFGDRREKERDSGRSSRHSRSDERGDRRDDRREQRQVSSYSDRRRESYEKPASSEGLWTHDKFLELEEDDGKSKGPTIVVDTSSSSRRRIVVSNFS